MRDDLHRGAEVVATAFFADHGLVDPARREVTVAPGRCAHEALVVTEIEVRFCSVGGHEDLTVLKRTHRARIHVDVRIQLDHADA